MKKLTPKQENFCREYIRTGNATQSYQLSYNCQNMKYDTIKSKACVLLAKDYIRETITRLDKQKENSKIADAQEIQEFLTKMMRGEIDEECVTVEGTGEGTSEARIINKQVTPKDRQKAGETLAKMRGYFDIKIKIDNTPIIKDDI